jgi:hypothetical protein
MLKCGIFTENSPVQCFILAWFQVVYSARVLLSESFAVQCFILKWFQVVFSSYVLLSD